MLRTHFLCFWKDKKASPSDTECDGLQLQASALLPVMVIAWWGLVEKKMRLQSLWLE